MAWSHLVKQGRHFSNSACYALPQFCSCPILYRHRTASRSDCTHLHYRSFTFLIQTLFLPATTKNKEKKTSHGNGKLYWEGDRADGSQQPTVTTSCGTSQITALKLHQWRTTTQSCVLLLAPDPFIPEKPLHECYTPHFTQHLPPPV